MPIASHSRDESGKSGSPPELEKRTARDHDGLTTRIADRMKRILVPEPEPRVDSVHCPGIHSVADLESADDTAASLVRNRLDEIPFRAHVDISGCSVGLSERRYEIVPQVHEPLDHETFADIVIVEGELVAPGLQGIVDVTVHDHVLVQPVESEPVIVVA